MRGPPRARRSAALPNKSAGSVKPRPGPLPSNRAPPIAATRTPEPKTPTKPTPRVLKNSSSLHQCALAKPSPAENHVNLAKPSIVSTRPPVPIPAPQGIQRGCNTAPTTATTTTTRITTTTTISPAPAPPVTARRSKRARDGITETNNEAEPIHWNPQRKRTLQNGLQRDLRAIDLSPRKSTTTSTSPPLHSTHTISYVAPVSYRPTRPNYYMFGVATPGASSTRSVTSRQQRRPAVPQNTPTLPTPAQHHSAGHHYHHQPSSPAPLPQYTTPRSSYNPFVISSSSVPPSSPTTTTTTEAVPYLELRNGKLHLALKNPARVVPRLF
ncbi:hypothetical protein BJ085DRAFT_34098 [Dimargaris cristalligena]|uniref:Uncharacterized protein n=1 Tax=Dimargaris cristalligena TaxID=215637 RepID=A0A4Q0A2H3_9FUNG|nr:hypothetical protein BJ085DRAFT_34098 [Dimargaris cristalligena]|eukprot:RKP40028.1 hypothetical protein BJ085DRAFT_34098 [Dimargaris cristalligena]